MLDLSQLNKYKENNRIEAKKKPKKHKAVCPIAVGRHTRLLPILSAVIFCLAL